MARKGANFAQERKERKKEKKWTKSRRGDHPKKQKLMLCSRRLSRHVETNKNEKRKTKNEKSKN